MLRILTLSTLFPNAAQPTLGVFVERQTLGLAALDDVAVEVVSPIGLPPWPLSTHPHYASRASLREREQWKGLTMHRPRYRVVPGLGHRGTARAMARSALPLLREIRARFPFDVIDAEYFWPDGPAAMLLAKALGVPFSIKARGSDIQYWTGQPGIADQIVAAGKAADGMLAVSGALRDVMVSLGLPGERIRVHHTGIDLGRFVPIDRQAAKARLGIEGPLLVAAGALIPRKGQRLCLEALELLPDATLILVGDGPDRGALEALARRRGLGERVRFLGARPHEDMPGLLGAADVLLHASSSEGLANVWVEALACGTPVVAGDVGGARELFDRSEAGRLVALDARDIADAVRALLASPPDQGAVRETAMRFSWGKNALELRDHLAGLAPPIGGTVRPAA